MASTHFSSTVIVLDDWPLVSKSLIKSDAVFCFLMSTLCSNTGICVTGKRSVLKKKFKDL